MTGNVALNGGSIRERNNIIWAVSAVVLSGGLSAAIYNVTPGYLLTALNQNPLKYHHKYVTTAGGIHKELSRSYSQNRRRSLIRYLCTVQSASFLLLPYDVV